MLVEDASRPFQDTVSVTGLLTGLFICLPPSSSQPRVPEFAGPGRRATSSPAPYCSRFLAIRPWRAGEDGMDDGIQPDTCWTWPCHLLCWQIPSGAAYHPPSWPVSLYKLPLFCNAIIRCTLLRCFFLFSLLCCSSLFSTHYPCPKSTRNIPNLEPHLAGYTSSILH